MNCFGKFDTLHYYLVQSSCSNSKKSRTTKKICLFSCNSLARCQKCPSRRHLHRFIHRLWNKGQNWKPSVQFTSESRPGDKIESSAGFWSPKVSAKFWHVASFWAGVLATGPFFCFLFFAFLSSEALIFVTNILNRS